MGLFASDRELRKEAVVKLANVDSAMPALLELQKIPKPTKVSVFRSMKASHCFKLAPGRWQDLDARAIRERQKSSAK